MTYFLVTLAVVVTFLAMWFLHRAFYWHGRYINSGISLELQFATQQQIIDELRNRPNTSFLMLEPAEDKEGGLLVTTHAWNLKPEVILASLKAAHDGMVDHLGLEEDESEGSEDDA